MDANKKDNLKKDEDVNASMNTDRNAEEQHKKQEEGKEKIPNHTSQGHTTGATGSATNSEEPTLRSATTDSSRVPKNRNDDLPTGGNIR